MSTWRVGAAFLIAAACVGCGGENNESGHEQSSEGDAVRCLKPESDVFTNFATGSSYSDDVSITSLTYTYPSGLSTTFGDMLRVNGIVSTYSGVGVAFGACVDASAFSAVEFDIWGDVGPSRQLWLYAATRENRPEPPSTETGTCEPIDPAQPFRSCQDAYTTIGVTLDGARQTVRFSSFGGGIPNARVDRSELLSLVFALDWNDSQAQYPIDLSLGDLRFVP